jgi:hypothetical protein
VAFYCVVRFTQTWCGIVYSEDGISVQSASGDSLLTPPSSTAAAELEEENEDTFFIDVDLGRSLTHPSRPIVQHKKLQIFLVAKHDVGRLVASKARNVEEAIAALGAKDAVKPYSIEFAKLSK